MAYFAASVETPENNRKFAEQLGVDYPLLSDPTRQAALAYGVVKDSAGFATRATFYIDVDGRILFVDRQVNPGRHGEDIATKLAELGVPKRTARRPR